MSKYPHATGTATLAIRILSEALTLAMTATSNRVEMMSFETATIKLRLESDGIGVPSARIAATSLIGDSFSAVEDLGDGEYVVRWEASPVTVQTFASILMMAEVGGYADARSRVIILVDPDRANSADPTQLFVLAIPEQTVVGAGESVAVTVYAFTIEGFVVSGASVTVSTEAATPGTVSAVLDQLNGVYTFTFTAGTTVTETGVTIRIDIAKFGYAAATTRTGMVIIP